MMATTKVEIMVPAIANNDMGIMCRKNKSRFKIYPELKIIGGSSTKKKSLGEKLSSPSATNWLTLPVNNESSSPSAGPDTGVDT
mmetsp:Transcript_30813/g.46986  ORF Transcript_30813/g.46986 Transcript_30813/m.46986 type:complete len:84 (+) Transcript_30813:1334-1585(+)